MNEGRATSGYPNSRAAASHSASVWQARLRGTSAPRPVTMSLNRCRSSAAVIASMLAPMSSTPYLVSVPAVCRPTAALRAVWPPRVGRSASGRSAAITFSSTSAVIGST